MAKNDQGTSALTPPAPSRRSGTDAKKSLIAVAVALGIAIFIFGFVLPQVIDYKIVFDVLRNLEPQDYAIIIGAGLFLYGSLMPGVGLRRCMSAWSGQLTNPFALASSGKSEPS